MPLLLADHHIPAPSHRAAPCLSLRGQQTDGVSCLLESASVGVFWGLVSAGDPEGVRGLGLAPACSGTPLRASSVREPRGPPASPGFGPWSHEQAAEDGTGRVHSINSSNSSS